MMMSVAAPISRGILSVAARSLVEPVGIYPMGTRLSISITPLMVSLRVPSPPQQTTRSFPSPLFLTIFVASP